MPQKTPTFHEWNEWLASQELGSLYQTSIWANFQEQIPGKEKSQLVTVQDPQTEAILGGGFLVKHALPFSLSWLECPRGPVFDSNLSEDQIDMFFEIFLEKVRAIAAQEKSVFLRIDPPMLLTSDQKNDYEFVLSKQKFRAAHASYFPQTTLTLDLNLSEEELLQQMKPKGRYNIKVAQKHDVYIKKIAPESVKKHIEEFHPLIEETARRDHFFVHDAKYYETMLTTLGDSAALWLAYKDEPNQPTPTPLAGLIATYHANTATYYYGASCYDHRHMMAPYLLQWEVIRDAKEQQYSTYDFLGIAPTEAKNHPWQGVTEFKTKFGGSVVSYIAAKEFVFKTFWYFVMLLRKKFRE